MASSYDVASETEKVKKNDENIALGEINSPRYDATQDQTLDNDPRTQNIALSTLRGPMKPVNTFLHSIENGIKQFFIKQSTFCKITLGIIFFTLYVIYFVFACTKNFVRASDLVYVTGFAVFCFLYWLIKKYCGRFIWKGFLKPIQSIIFSHWKVLKWSTICLFVAFLIFWIFYDTRKKPDRLISLAGLFVYILIGFLGSKSRDKIKWRPVLWGFALQFIFGLLILRTDAGFQFFKWLGDRISIFLSFSTAGSDFLFPKLNQFAFTVLPVIVYFSAFTYVMYYLGIIQIVIKKIAWLLQVTLGTSPAESVNAAGNIFVGQSEAPLLIRPFLEGMTASELHAVMTGGFATIAGSVLGAYISFGVSASHLLSASVMSAPAALAMSKLMYPETEESTVKTVDDINIEKTDEKNVFEALAVGASMSIGLVANISVMLISFLSILSLFNTTLHWLGGMVDVPQLSFEYICSYLFAPFAYIMGVEWKDSFEVAELLGVKTFLNEFIAYERLAKLIVNRVYNTGRHISVRSEVIATYALCGFANFGSMGVQLGSIASLAPSKRSILSKIVLRALLAGTLACFMTACIAGLLYDEERYDTTIVATSTTRLMNITTTGSTPTTANSTLVML